MTRRGGALTVGEANPENYPTHQTTDRIRVHASSRAPCRAPSDGQRWYRRLVAGCASRSGHNPSETSTQTDPTEIERTAYVRQVSRADQAVISQQHPPAMTKTRDPRTRGDAMTHQQAKPLSQSASALHPAMTLTAQPDQPGQREPGRIPESASPAAGQPVVGIDTRLAAENAATVTIAHEPTGHVGRVTQRRSSLRDRTDRHTPARQRGAAPHLVAPQDGTDPDRRRPTHQESERRISGSKAVRQRASRLQAPGSG